MYTNTPWRAHTIYPFLANILLFALRTSRVSVPFSQPWITIPIKSCHRQSFIGDVRMCSIYVRACYEQNQPTTIQLIWFNKFRCANANGNGECRVLQINQLQSCFRAFTIHGRSNNWFVCLLFAKVNLVAGEECRLALSADVKSLWHGKAFQFNSHSYVRSVMIFSVSSTRCTVIPRSRWLYAAGRQKQEFRCWCWWWCW